MQLKKCLAVLGVRQVDLAELTGIQSSHINAFCSGTRRPNIDNLVKIAVALGCSTDALLGLDNDPTVVLARIPSTTLMGELGRRLAT